MNITILIPIAAFILLSFSTKAINTEPKKTNTMNTSVKTNPPFEFGALPYAYDALEPYIDKMTMEIHYSRHHKAYFDNFIKAISGTPLEKMSAEDIFAEMSKHPAAVRNNGGGWYNHNLFWENLAPSGVKISARFLGIIEKEFGSIGKFQEEFAGAGASRFGSGWAWLNLGSDGKLFISSTPNQDNPLMDVSEKRGIPLLALDVWEHAYYLKYQNKRADYISAFWSVVNWDVVESRYDQAKK
jgi:superoxide dismutase, Fe-Mn family